MASRHIRFEPIGGVAGDMLVGALLDAFPDAWPAVSQAVEVATRGEAKATLEPWRDHTLAGKRFEVATAVARHEHRRLREIEALLGEAAISPAIRDHAAGIFRVLAEAEGRVHGIEPGEVTFHEVGALDSIADIVAAAALIDHLRGASYSISPLPLGSGRVETAHGTLPVPAPAVVELLRDFVVHDDGIAGERVTPTGAAILKYLAPTCEAPPKGRLVGGGLGFGTRRLPRISNVLRVLVLEPTAGSGDVIWRSEQVALIAFEVDDQSPEDLALALDRLRAVEGVLDVLQAPVMMKKGRIGATVQVLATPESETRVIAACFDETTTIGLRHSLIERAVLPRRLTKQAENGPRLKIVQRPGGRRTAKAESDDLAVLRGQKSRAKASKLARVSALADEDDDG